MSITLEDIRNLSREVSSLVNAGLPLESHLAAAGAGHGKRLQQLTESISTGLQNGESLSDTVRNNKVGAPRMLAAAVAAGVQTGKLNETVQMLGDMANDLVDLRQRILQSLSYPLTVIATALVLFVVFIRTFLARVHHLINEHDVSASWWFRTLLEFDNRFWWWPVLFPVAGIVWMLFWVVSGRAAAMAFRGPECLLFLIPGVRAMIRDLQFYSLVRMLTLMVEHKIPLPDALTLSGACSGNTRLDASCRTTADQIRTGDLPALRPGANWKQGHLPPLLTVCLQQTGLSEQQLNERLSGVSGYYRRRLQLSVAWLRNIVPVAMFVVLGGGTVALYGLTVFWPVTQIYEFLAPQ